MKIQIDTNAKTIKVEEKIKFGELVAALKALFPDGAWKEYDMIPEIIQDFSNPIYIRTYPYWSTSPFYVGGTTADLVVTNCISTGTYVSHPNNQNFTLTSGTGTYNIEVPASEN
jgi:hypothetical protein